MKATYGIFKQSPTRQADFLSDNDIVDCHDDQMMKSFFPHKICGHRWLENDKTLTRFMKISEKEQIILHYRRRERPGH